jgi:hypothetical protein
MWKLVDGVCINSRSLRLLVPVVYEKGHETSDDFGWWGQQPIENNSHQELRCLKGITKQEVRLKPDCDNVGNFYLAGPRYLSNQVTDSFIRSDRGTRWPPG